MLVGSAAAAQQLTASSEPMPATKQLVIPANRPNRASVNLDSTYVNPDLLPSFTGGQPALGAYLEKNMRYPAVARQQRVSGRVLVTFVLSPEGRVIDAHVKSGVGAGLNEEALRLVWLMPAWQPGKQQGQPVRTVCTIPIMFQPQ